MGKRGAEDQLTKDDAPSDHEGDEEPGVRTESLKPVEGRKIRGLPKRKDMEAPAPAAAAPPTSGFSFGAPASTSTFSFGGASNGGPSTFSFGAAKEADKPAEPAAPSVPASSSAPFGGFSFGKPQEQAKDDAPEAPASKPAFSGFAFGKSAAPTPAEPPKKSAAPLATGPKAAFSGFSFGSKPAEASTSSGSSTAVPPKEPSTSSATVSFGRTPSTSKLAAPAGSASRSVSGPGPSQASPPDEGEVSFYTALRGLNTSFLSFLSQSLNSNEFLDLTTILPDLLSQYKTHLKEAADKAGWHPQTDDVEMAEGNATNGSSSSAAEQAPAPAPEKPKAPEAPKPSPFGGFSFGSGAATSSKPSGSSSPKKSASAVNKIVEAALADDAPEPSKASADKEAPKFSFGSSASKPAGSLFSFAPSGPLHPTTPESKKFAPSTTTPASDPPSKLGKFGPDGSTPQLSFGGAKGTSPGTPASTTAGKGFSFGAPSSSGAGFSFGGGSAAADKSDKTDKAAEKPAFAFGTAATKPAETSKTFSFGSSSAETQPADAPKSGFAFGTGGAGASKPSGFSFGSSASNSESAGAKASPFSFGAPAQGTSSPFSFGTPASSAPASQAVSGTATPVSGEAAVPEDDGGGTTDLSGASGAGEEDEETVGEYRGKLLALEDGKFDVVGLGQFKIKRAKAGGKRRLLMRTEGTGKVVLNMALLGSFKVTAEETAIRFLGFDLKGQPKPYALRVKKGLAAELAEMLTKEAEDIKAEGA